MRRPGSPFDGHDSRAVERPASQNGQPVRLNRQRVPQQPHESRRLRPGSARPAGPSPAGIRTSGNTCEATAPRLANRRTRSPRDRGTAPSPSTPDNATAGERRSERPRRPAESPRCGAIGALRSSVRARGISAAPAGDVPEASRSRSAAAIRPPGSRSTAASALDSSGTPARKSAAVIVPVGNAGVEDLDPGRRAIDLRGEVRDRPEVRMRLQPHVPSHRLNVPRWAAPWRTGISRAARPKRKIVAAIRPIETPHSTIDGT